MKAFALLLVLSAAASAQNYPSRPTPLPEAEEIALAMSAAPAEVSSRADIYVLRGTKFVKAKAGTNGCACMVGRDSHAGSAYPICYDQEGARTTLWREIMQSSLRAKGATEAEIEKAVAAAYASGELKRPTRPALAYMLSPQQVLFSSPNAQGRRVGAWWPHLMLLMPGTVTPAHLGLADSSSVDFIQIHGEGEHHSELIVKVPKWSTGKAVSP
jgi:hypothetical protein